MANGRRRSKTWHSGPRAKSSLLPSNNQTKSPVTPAIHHAPPPQPRKDPLASSDRPQIQRLPPLPPRWNNRYPWLLFKGYKHQIFCSTVGDSHMRSIPELRNRTVIACCEDWLVLCGKKTTNASHRSYSLLNILTFESITLPPFRSSFDTEGCVLSSPPHTTCNAMVLLFERNHSIISFVMVGNHEWTEMELENKFYMPACCNGVIYVTQCGNKDLFRIDVDDSKLVLVPLDTRLADIDYYTCTPCSNVFLVSSGAELITIKILLGGRRWDEVLAIAVHKLNFATKEWARVDNCKDHVFFLGPSYNVSCPASSGVEGGLVYFTRHKYRKVYSYNIEDRSLSMKFSYPNLSLQRSAPVWLVHRHVEMSDYDIDNDDIYGDKEGLTVDIRSEVDYDIDNEDIYGDEESTTFDIRSEVGLEDSKEPNLLLFPLELLEKVAGNLILLDYMCFRAVCQQFLLAAPAIQWKEALVRNHYLSPMFIFNGKDRKVFTHIDPEQNGKYFIRIPTEVKDAFIHYSRDGWLLMSRTDASLFFFNPFTKVVIRVPKLDGCFPDLVFFSSMPTSPNCLVLGILAMPKGIGLLVFGLGGEEWDYIAFGNGPPFVPNHIAPVWWNDSFYVMSQEGKLGVVHVGPSYDWKVLDKLKSPCNSFDQCFIVKSDKELLSIFLGELGRWVKVFRLNISALTWQEVNSLGTHTVFLSRSSAFSMVAKYKYMEDRIYFPRLRSGKTVFYSLETRKFHSLCGEDSLNDYVGTMEQLECSWIEPRWL